MQKNSSSARSAGIALLPVVIRQELTRRMLRRENDNSLLAWLNSRPEVAAALASGELPARFQQPDLALWMDDVCLAVDVADRPVPPAPPAESSETSAIQRLANDCAMRFFAAAGAAAADPSEDNVRQLQIFTDALQTLRDLLKTEGQSQRVAASRERVAYQERKLDYDIHRFQRQSAEAAPVAPPAPAESTMAPADAPRASQPDIRVSKPEPANPGATPAEAVSGSTPDLRAPFRAA